MISLAVLFGLGWIPLYVFRAEDPGAALPRYSSRERFWVITTPGLVGLHATVSCVETSVASGMPAWRATLSAGVFAAGILFWTWARMKIAPLSKRRLPDEGPPVLHTDGPFGVVRNPLYLGVLVAMSASLVASPSAILAGTFLAAAGALAIRAAQEERRLHDQLGPAYGEYCAHVKRLIPFVW